MTEIAAKKPTKKSSSVRHTRAIQRDRSKRPLAAPPDEQISQRLTEIVHPAILAQVAHYHDLGLRERVLNLPVMVALVLSMIWRQLAGVSDLVRLLREEGLLWAAPQRVSQQAVSQRLRTLPAELFLRLLLSILPRLQERWQARQRPVPPEIAWAQAHYRQVLVHDGSTLDALLRKVGLLRDMERTPLAGRMTALLDLASRLPCQIWYEEDAQAHDQRCWPQIQAMLAAGSLLIFDLGYVNFQVFAQLAAAHVTWLTRAKSNLAYTVERELQRTAAVHETLVWIGQGQERQLVRLISVLYHGTWYRYLTNELDRERLPAPYADVILDATTLRTWFHDDPDAAWSYRKPGKGAVWGYKVHTLLCRWAQLPLMFVVTPAQRHDSVAAIPVLLLAVACFGLQIAIVRADAAYFTHPILDFIRRVLGASAVIDYNLRRQGKRKLATPFFLNQWRLHQLPRRIIERHFAWAKRYLGLEAARWNGLVAAYQHTALVYSVMLGVALVAHRYQRPELAGSRYRVLALKAVP